MSQNYPTCNHILPNGNRCRAAALRHEQFCLYHHPTRRPPSRKSNPKPVPLSFGLPALNTATAIQIALSDVACRVANNTLDLHRANLILGVLQIARTNLVAACGLAPVPVPDSSDSGDLAADLAGIMALLGSPSTDDPSDL